ncbi:MAG: efflux transporter periplasmic adaptor subunit, partial [Paraburkholderia sp.]|nr:efflux transporter periplasmic adaptor subunit [Paraburkholderia sp.]
MTNHSETPSPQGPHEPHTAPRGSRRWPLVLAALIVLGLAAQGIWSRHSAHAALER